MTFEEWCFNRYGVSKFDLCLLDGLALEEAYNAGRKEQDAALALGREEGRKERTVEIHKLVCGYHPPLRGDYVAHTIYREYPECFEKGESDV